LNLKDDLSKKNLGKDDKIRDLEAQLEQSKEQNNVQKNNQ